MSAEHDEPRILPMVRPRGLIEAIVEEVLAERAERPAGRQGCTVTIDVADRHVLLVDPATIRSVLTGLLTAALDNAARTERGETPVEREVVVTSVEYADQIEIEFADSGPACPQTDAARVLESPLQELLASVGGQLAATACAEGGRAITLRLPHRRLRRRAA